MVDGQSLYLKTSQNVLGFIASARRLIKKWSAILSTSQHSEYTDEYQNPTPNHQTQPISTNQRCSKCFDSYKEIPKSDILNSLY